MKHTIKYLAIYFTAFIAAQGYSQTLTLYPNPFTQTATIEFTLTSPDTTTLAIIDIFGQQVRTVLNDTLLQANHYSFILNGDSLANGIYIVKLKHGATNTTSRLIKQGNVSSITEINGISDNLFYPNPATNKLTFKNDLSGSTISIIDLSGKEVFVPMQNNEVNISALSSGLYYLKIQSENKSLMSQFVKE